MRVPHGDVALAALSEGGFVLGEEPDPEGKLMDGFALQRNALEGVFGDQGAFIKL